MGVVSGARRVAACAALLALPLAAGCGRQTSQPVAVQVEPSATTVHPAADDVVPWADRPFQSHEPREIPPTPVDRSVPLCRARQLSAAFAGRDAATATRLLHLDIRNESRSPCRAEGRARRITGIQAGVRRTLHLYREDFPGPYSPVVLKPGEAAGLTMTYIGRCDLPEDKRQPPYRDLYLTAFGGEIKIRPGGGIGELDLGCRPPSEDDIGATDIGVVVETQYAPDPTQSLRVRIQESPAPVRPGEVLRYVVTLSNPTREAIALDPCPSFSQSVPDLGVKSPNQLNCPKARPVPARGEERFAMQLTIPSTAAPGRYPLHWLPSSIDVDPAETTLTVL